ncbi:MAG TPA: hypothetical protein PLZ43_08745 [bacterium]|nr:hypothetical protein [bacterium]
MKNLFFSRISVVAVIAQFMLTSCCLFFCDDNKTRDHDYFEDLDEEYTTDNDNSDFTFIDSDMKGLFDEKPPISFYSRPHGIIRWNEEFKYFVVCKSKDNSDTSVSISAGDTCKGLINSGVYKFTPDKSNFPDGKCLISIECSDGNAKTNQKTEILIPNPVEIISTIEEPLFFEIIWSGETHALFYKNENLYSVTKELDSLTLIASGFEGNYLDGFSTAKFFYYIKNDLENNKNAIMRTDGTLENTIEILSKEDFPEDSASDFVIDMVSYVENDRVIFFNTSNETSFSNTTWYFNNEDNTLTPVTDSRNIYYVFCNLGKCIFSSYDGDFYEFDETDKLITEICPHPDTYRLKAEAFIGNRIFYKKDSQCYSVLDIESCEEQNYCECEENAEIIFNQKAENDYLHVLSVCNNEAKTTVSLFTTEGETKSSVLNGIYKALITLDGKSIYQIEKYDFEPDTDRNCLRKIEIGGSVTNNSLFTCHFDEEYNYSGNFGNSIVLKRNSLNENPGIIFMSDDGIITEKESDLKITPLNFSYSVDSNGEEETIYLFTDEFVHTFKSDGSASNTHLINSRSIIFNPFPDIIANSGKEYVIKNGDKLYSYNLDSRKKETILTASGCMTSVSAYDAIVSKNELLGKFNYFWVSNTDSCGNYTLWITDGTKRGTKNIGISMPYEYLDFLLFGIKSDKEGGFYVFGTDHLYYIDKDGTKFTIKYMQRDYFLEKETRDRLIFSKTVDGEIEILAVEKGEIVQEVLFSEENYSFNLSVTEKNIQLLKTDMKTGKVEIMYLKNNDLFDKSPVETLFEENYTNINEIFVNDSLSLFTANDRKGWFNILKIAKFNDKDNSILIVPVLSYDSEDINFDEPGMIGNKLVFISNFSLYSITLDSNSANTEKISFYPVVVEKFVGSVFPERLLYASLNNDSISDLTLIDGIKNNYQIYIKKQDEDISIWNDWVFIQNQENGKPYFAVDEGRKYLNRNDLTKSIIQMSNTYVFEKRIYMKEVADDSIKPIMSYRLPETSP